MIPGSSLTTGGWTSGFSSTSASPAGSRGCGDDVVIRLKLYYSPRSLVEAL